MAKANATTTNATTNTTTTPVSSPTMQGWVKHGRPIELLQRLIKLIGWDCDITKEFLDGFTVLVDKNVGCLKAIPVKANKETNKFQREFVQVARQAGFRADYANNTGIWICYKKAEPKV